MSEQNKDGGAAFPGRFGVGHWPQQQSGMTLMDYFAGQATIEEINTFLCGFDFTTNKTINRNYAEARYAFADSMLAVRLIPHAV